MMNKSFKYYAGIWAVLFALFNIVTFVLVNEFSSIDYLEGSFWIGYVFIVVAFLGQLGVGYSVFHGKTMQKTFNRAALIRTCWSGLVAMFIVGTVCMAIEALPIWIAVIACFVTLGFSLIPLLKASAAAGMVDQIDEKIKVKTFFIKSLTVDADTLLASAKSEAAKEACRKVYEAARYSDPMSSEMLVSVEGQITIKFAELSKAVKEDNTAAIATAADEVLILLRDRNNKCKLLK